MNQCKAIHYKKQTLQEKNITETMYQINKKKRKKNQLSFRTPICHYNGILLMAWSNKNNYNKNNA